MEDFYIDVVVGKEEGAKSIRLDLPKFTLIGEAYAIPTNKHNTESRITIFFIL